MGGYPLAHAMMMMIPEAWAGNPLMDEERRAFYEYNAALMEPWDGPAAIAFTNGRQIGATLDRNGLRPARYIVTRDDRIIMASEVGVLPIPGRRDRHQVAAAAGQDAAGRPRRRPAHSRRGAQGDARRRAIPIGSGSSTPRSCSRTCRSSAEAAPISNLALLDRQQAFGYTQEDLKILMTPMATTGEEAIGSMGNDTPISALSDKPKLLFTYFKQNFAQVTNPPIDPIREELVMSLVSIIGPRPNLFDLEGLSNTKRLEVHQPILTNANLEKIRAISEVARVALQVDHARHDLAGRDRRRRHGSRRSTACAARPRQAVRDGINIIILSDRRAGADRIPIPSLLACAAVHHHLIREGLRTSVGLVVESGEPREVHHFACLAGYGAEAINPYLAFETLIAMKDELPQKLDDKEIVKRYIKSIDKGLLKVMSKMGISTYQSYCGAQIFDAVGLKSEFVAQIFHRHRDPHRRRRRRRDRRGSGAPASRCVFGDAPIYRAMLDVGGEYAFRVRGEDHVWNAATVAALQHAVRGNSLREVPAIRRASSTSSRSGFYTIRGLFRIKAADEDGRTAGADRGGRAGGGDRQALRHRRHVASARSRARRTPRSPSP